MKTNNYEISSSLNQIKKTTQSRVVFYLYVFRINLI